MKHSHKTYLLTLTALMVLSTELRAQGCSPDALPRALRAERDVRPLPCQTLPESMADPDFEPVAELTIENLMAVLEKYEVKHAKVVAAQAILETGYFSSTLCQESHNLFGLRHPSDGSYYTFDNWEQSVKAYVDDVQYKYTGGDYYSFLNRIGYAEDRKYTAKVRKIANRL